MSSRVRMALVVLVVAGLLVAGSRAVAETDATASAKKPADRHVEKALRTLRELRVSVERIWTEERDLKAVIGAYDKHMATLTSLDLRTLAGLRGDLRLTALEMKLAEIAIDRKIRPDLYRSVQAAIEVSYKSLIAKEMRRMPGLSIPTKLRTPGYRLVWEEVLLRPCSLKPTAGHRLTSNSAALALETIGHAGSIEVFAMAYRLSLPRRNYKAIRSRLLGAIALFAKGSDDAQLAAFEAAYECYSITTDPGEQSNRLAILKATLAPATVERLIKDTQARSELLKRVRAIQQKAKADRKLKRMRKQEGTE